MIAVVFPGQGSQKPWMGKELHDTCAEAREVFARASDASGVDVRTLCFDTDEETLRQTQNAQLALYTCGVAAWECLHARAPQLAPLFAGHSVGEYAALAAARVLSVEDGARLVQRRGDLMARSGNLRPGTMAAVLGLERADLDAVCAEATEGDSVAVVANDNCPGQLVISGDVDAVRRASELASSRGAKRVLPLNVSGAFHSPLMREAAQAMGEALRLVAFAAGAAVVSNVTAQPVTDASQWPGLLERQLESPVRWTESIGAIRAAGVQVQIECGVGEVLGGLARRIDKEIEGMRVSDPESLEAAVVKVGGVS